MKRIMQYFVFLMMFLLIACSKVNQPTEWINVINSEGPFEIYKIKDIDLINKINEVLAGFKWQDKQIDTIGNPDYRFWLEREKEEKKITSYEIWFDERGYSAVMVEYVHAKFATIDRVELEQLFQLLESGHSVNERP